MSVPPGFSSGSEARVSLLREHHQHVRLGDVRIRDRLGGKHYRRARRAAARLRPEVLGHGGVGALKDGGGLADDGGGQNHALATEPRDSNFT